MPNEPKHTKSTCQTVSSARQGSGAQVDSIQLLRFFAAFIVVVFHANIFAEVSFQDDANYYLTRMAQIGEAGVPIFFVISGFIMVHTSANYFGRPGSVSRFLKRRVLRVYPIYWICLILFLVFGSDRTSGLKETIGVIFLVPGYAKLIISPAWTLVYEMYFYLVFGLLLIFPRKQALLCISVFFAFSILIGSFFGIGDFNAFTRHMSNPLLLDFLAGILVAASLNHSKLAAIFRTRAFVNSAFFLSLAGLMAIPVTVNIGLPKVVVFGVPSALLVASSVYGEQLGKLPSKLRGFAWLGDSSYSLYLIHILVMILCRPIGSALMDTWGFSHFSLILLYSILSVISGLILYYTVERPVLRFCRKKFLATG